MTRHVKSGKRPQSSNVHSVRAVERALDTMACLAEEELRLVDIASRLGLHKATVARLLATLSRAGGGMVSRDADGRYALGPGAVLLARPFLVRYRMLVDFVREPLRRIWIETRETVTVHTREKLDRLCIEELESPEPIVYRARVGSRQPLHVGAAGKVQLAFLPDAELGAVLKELKLVAVTERTITDRQQLIHELADIRRAGYATSAGEAVRGVAGVAVPIMDREGRPVASVTVVGPESRLPAETIERYAALLKAEIRPLPLAVQHVGLPVLSIGARSDPPDSSSRASGLRRGRS